MSLWRGKKKKLQNQTPPSIVHMCPIEVSRTNSCPKNSTMFGMFLFFPGAMKHTEDPGASVSNRQLDRKEQERGRDFAYHKITLHYKHTLQKCIRCVFTGLYKHM